VIRPPGAIAPYDTCGIPVKDLWIFHDRNARVKHLANFFSPPKNLQVFYSVQFQSDQFIKIAAGIGCAAMPLFRVGDRVERIGVLGPQWMKVGIITRVIPNEYGIESATEYEVDFGELAKATLYQVELRLVKTAQN